MKMTKELHAIFCDMDAQFGVRRTVLKAIAQTESSWNPRAYRYEPEFFQRLKKEEPFWADKDPSIVSASYGYMQILFTTAWALGTKPANWQTMSHAEFQSLAERLYDPVTNIRLGAILMRKLIDKVWADSLPQRFEKLSAYDIALARYNGGSWKNPDQDPKSETFGTLRNIKYVNKIWRAYDELLPQEAACEDKRRA